MDFKTLRENCPFWEKHIKHDFVEQLATAKLAKESFQHYLQQDYLFLLQFTRAWALAIYKSNSFEEMRHGQIGVNAMMDFEIQLHIEYCKSWGISEQSLLKISESTACISYTRYVLDCCMSGSLAELYAAVTPCVLGYAEIGKNIAEREKVINNPYQSWIDMYSSETFQTAAAQIGNRLDELSADICAKQAAKLQFIFNTATRMEVAFWQMGLDLS